jgi:hypothetical protein
MTTQKLMCVLLASLVAISGCVPSINPVYRTEDLVFEAAVLGSWTQDGAKWEFSKRDESSYWLVYTDDKGQQGRFIAHLAKIESELFLDLFPDDSGSNASGFYKFHLVPIHTIYRVRDTAPNLTLAAIDYKWLDTELGKQPTTIQSTTFDGRRLITASTDEVRAFVLKNKNSFNAEFKLERRAAGK